MIDLELFSDIHGVAPGTEPNADAPKNNACRSCAAEIFLWGLKEWWLRERVKGFVEESIINRKDCPEGAMCARHKDDLGGCIIFPRFIFVLVLIILSSPSSSPCQRMLVVMYHL